MRREAGGTTVPMRRVTGLSSEGRLRLPFPGERRGTSCRGGGRILVLVLGVLLGFTGPGMAADSAALFDAAARAYQTGKFREAAAAYDALVTNGVATPAVLLNQGHAWFKAGEVGRAIVRYRQAQSLEPRSREIAAALAAARSKVPGAAPAPFALGGLTLGLGLLSPREWCVAGLALMWLWGVLMGAREVVPGARGRLGAVSGFLGVGVGAVLAIIIVVTLRERQGGVVVVAREASVRFGPLEESQTAFALPDGAEAVIVDRKESWRQIRDRGGRTGWVAGNQILEIH